MDDVSLPKIVQKEMNAMLLYRTRQDKFNFGSKNLSLTLDSKSHTFSYENECNFYSLLSIFMFVEIPLTARIATCISEGN